MKVCSEPGCPTLVDAGRCAEHRRDRERQRGSKQARGYGYRHQQLRLAWVPKVAKGDVACARCHERISPLEVWHLDHTDDRTGYLGPSHERCNVSAPRRA